MRIAILGAGISGLTLGYYLKKSQPDCEIEIFEKSARVGGTIHTLKKGGFVFEQGPRGVRPKGKGAEVLELSHDVGLGSEVIFANKEASVRYIYCDRRLHKAPISLGSVITSPLTRGWMKALWKDVTAKPYNASDETLGSFSRRRFGESITRNIIDPFASGVWAGDIERLSFHSVFPALANIESKHGSFIKGWARKHNDKSQKSKIKSALFSFRHGMQMLPYYLSRRLEKNLRLSTPIEDLTFSDGKFRLYSQGVSWSFDKVISTLPAYQNATLLTEAHDELIRNLKDIEYAPLAIVSLGFDRKVNPYRGFGYLVPHQEREMILGAVWNDQTFREHSDNNASSMTVMIGGAFFQQFGSFSEDDFIRIAITSTREHLGIDDNPVIKLCRILPRAIPQYNVGHADKIKAIKQRSPFGLTFFGNFMSGISIGSIVSSAKDLTENHQKVYDIVREA